MTHKICSFTVITLSKYSFRKKSFIFDFFLKIKLFFTFHNYIFQAFNRRWDEQGRSTSPNKAVLHKAY